MDAEEIPFKPFATILAGVLLLAFGGCYAGSHVHVSDGYRDSTVRKVSETGVIFKTWEVESLGDGIRMSSTKEGTSVSPETFRYSVADADVLNVVRNLPPGKRVRIHYRSQLSTWKPRGESSYFLTGIDVLTD